MNTPTFLGLLAILLWSSTIGFSRSVSEKLGPLTSGFIIFILAGLVSCFQVLLQQGSLRPIFRLPKLYLFGAGAFFTSYEVALYLSIGLSQTREQVLVVGLINYLWPVFILVSAVPNPDKPEPNRINRERESCSKRVEHRTPSAKEGER